MQDQKQQIIDRIKQASNILVTVSTNPSVDQLASCIGMTVALNKIEKRATAVFSGQVPSTIEFLEPQHTLEKTTDSLRDFIISLDKTKADKLRYKVEDDVVKIFITPYKTSLSEKDLVYGQGDFNVDVVIALGVHEQQELDQAITAHGRILHDAAVISINTATSSELGSINWSEPQASSLSEMVTSLTAGLGENILDTQIATAFLTGIVAETSRFSNEKTTPVTMSVSSQLMTAGANQQLIATKLQEPEPLPQIDAASADTPVVTTETTPADETLGAETLVPEAPVKKDPEIETPTTPDGAVVFEHPNDEETTETNPVVADEALEETKIDDIQTEQAAALPTDQQDNNVVLSENAHGNPEGQAEIAAVKPLPDEQPVSTKGRDIEPLHTTDIPPPAKSDDIPLPAVADTVPIIEPSSTPNADPLASLADQQPEAAVAPPLDSSSASTELPVSPAMQYEEMTPAAYTTPAPSSHVDNARSAVDQALSAMPAPLEPTQALNANPLGSVLHDAGEAAPPAVINPEQPGAPAPPEPNPSAPGNIVINDDGSLQLPNVDPSAATGTDKPATAPPPPVPPPMTPFPQ